MRGEGCREGGVRGAGRAGVVPYGSPHPLGSDCFISPRLLDVKGEVSDTDFTLFISVF